MTRTTFRLSSSSTTVLINYRLASGWVDLWFLTFWGFSGGFDISWYFSKYLTFNYQLCHQFLVVCRAGTAVYFSSGWCLASVADGELRLTTYGRQRSMPIFSPNRCTRRRFVFTDLWWTCGDFMRWFVIVIYWVGLLGAFGSVGYIRIGFFR